MRLSICTVVAALFASTIAAPTLKPDSLANVYEMSEAELVRRDGGDGKYFHEPG